MLRETYQSTILGGYVPVAGRFFAGFVGISGGGSSLDDLPWLTSIEKAASELLGQPEAVVSGFEQHSSPVRAGIGEVEPGNQRAITKIWKEELTLSYSDHALESLLLCWKWLRTLLP